MGKRKDKRLAEKIKSLVFDKDGFKIFTLTGKNIWICLMSFKWS